MAVRVKVEESEEVVDTPALMLTERPEGTVEFLTGQVFFC
jgi:hypothetical protein